MKLIQLLRSRGWQWIFVSLLFGSVFCGVFSLVTPVMQLTNTSVIAKVAFYDRLLLDWALLSMIGLWLMQGVKWLRYFAYLLLLVMLVIYALQTAAVYIGGTYVTPLAVSNLNHISLLVTPSSTLLFGLLIVLWVSAVWYLELNRFVSMGLQHCLLTTLALLGLCYLFYAGQTVLPRDYQQQVQSLFSHKQNFVDRGSPLKRFVRVLRSQVSQVPELTDAHFKMASMQNIDIHTSSLYPLVSNSIYGTYADRFGYLSDWLTTIDKPNVIVLFAEGVSARTTNVYGTTFPQLTPNMESFANQALVFDDYFNHTFATYRGLHGQHCSLFPTYGGVGGWHTEYEELKTVDYLCLSHLFNDVGYQSIFLDTHRRDAGFIDEMMLQLGFDSIINAEDAVAAGYVTEPLRPDALSDTQLFSTLIGWLTDRERAADAQPLFLGMYNLETHAWQQIANDGKKYSLQDNYILDSIHNYDYNFGRFWNYFTQSSWFENTVVIVTSDHAHYPDRDYRKLMQGQNDYRAHFVDEIPLMIYLPGLDRPDRVSVGGATSVNFAPTVAHLLGLPNASNPFWGQSMLANGEEQVGLAAGGAELFVIRDGLPLKKGKDLDSDDPAHLLFDLIENARELERHNKVWTNK